jgi:hypothetical protein
MHQYDLPTNRIPAEKYPLCRTLKEAFAGSFISKDFLSDNVFGELDRYVMAHFNSSFARGPSELIAWQPFTCRFRFQSPSVRGCHGDGATALQLMLCALG